VVLLGVVLMEAIGQERLAALNARVSPDLTQLHSWMAYSDEYPQQTVREKQTRAGACEDHPCDQCSRCRHMRCCLRDRPGYRLPELGEWDGPVHGSLGVLASVGAKVQCHICGALFDLLGVHVVRKHGLWPAEYRALFGLRAETGLAGPALKDFHRRNAKQKLGDYWSTNLPGSVTVLTAQQLSVLGRGRKMRLEARLDPNNQQARREAARRVGDLLHERYAAGELGAPQPRDVRAASKKGNDRRREHLRDPAYRAQFTRKISAARGHRQFICDNCGAVFIRTPTWSGSRVCSEVCLQERKRQTTRTLRPSARPEARAKISAAVRQRGARGAQYVRIIEGLRSLDAAAFAGLSGRERAIVRYYYGLDGARPWALSELMRQFNLTEYRVTRVLKQTVAGLLGSGVVKCEHI